MHVVMLKELDEGVDCASVFQIPDEGYVEAIYCAEFLSDSEKIEESLRGVFDAAVAAVDDWYRRVFLSNGSAVGSGCLRTTASP